MPKATRLGQNPNATQTHRGHRGRGQKHRRTPAKRKCADMPWDDRGLPVAPWVRRLAGHDAEGDEAGSEPEGNPNASGAWGEGVRGTDDSRQAEGGGMAGDDRGRHLAPWVRRL